jgi:hypothetical protein
MNPRCAHSTDTDLAGVICANPNNIDFRAQHESSDGLVDSTRMTVSVRYSNGTDTYSDDIAEGNPVTVTIGYRFTMVGPFSGVFPNGQLMFEAHATQNILDLRK